jgi:hypothetical protein
VHTNVHTLSHAYFRHVPQLPLRHGKWRQGSIRTKRTKRPMRADAPPIQLSTHTHADAACLDGGCCAPGTLWPCATERAGSGQLTQFVHRSCRETRAVAGNCAKAAQAGFPPIVVSASVFPKTVLYLKAEKVGNSGQGLNERDQKCKSQYLYRRYRQTQTATNFEHLLLSELYWRIPASHLRLTWRR